MHEEDDGVKHSPHRSSLPTVPSSSPFQTLRVTKSGATNGSIFLPKIEDAQASYNIKQGQFIDPRYLLGHTTIKQLTPYSTATLFKSKDQHNHNGVVGSSKEIRIVNGSPLAGNPGGFPATLPYTPKSIDDSWNSSHGNLVGTLVVGRPTSLTHLTTLGNAHPCNGAGNDNAILGKSSKPDNPNADTSDDAQDEYPLDSDSMEEDMVYLLGTALENVQEAHIPPSSVAQAWDRDSRSAVEYDSTLQHSSPNELIASHIVDVAENPNSNHDDLLDEDVDWNVVYTITSTVPNGASSTNLQNTANPLLQGQIARTEKIVECDARAEDTTPLKPFVRPPFPAKVRDRSVVSELSPRTVLRTCFRIGELVNQAIHCLNHRQDVVFELFARFIDLFKDQLPYPAGVLSNWRVGTQLDRQSAAFLDTRAEPKLCRCVCKPRRDPKVAIGLTLVVTAIREIDWAHIILAKKTVCRGSDDAARDIWADVWVDM
ncbi:hypothetical protein F4813DRAFT_378506 [Daldinia decipiens]|uniref:uncharacterized protein n=1 Tax=Daldinia decipiens TaxID=326647 RepID=UPI0020C45BF2|nr:uncharacterized protein F4813DRAFT_378506 [Daldinia decipiens]KAI1662170.1 hypothetical protein F4813DRAFT_378506 [Daldinia decipiens]